MPQFDSPRRNKKFTPSHRRHRQFGAALGVCVAVCSMMLLAPQVTATTMTTTTMTMTSLPASDSDAVTDTTFVWDLEKDPSECIGFLPKPGCGKEPQQAGDRGGALQWTVFGLIMTGVAVIGTVIARNIIRRDRAIADQLSNDASNR